LYPVLDWLLRILAIDQSPLGPPNSTAIALVAAGIAIVGVWGLFQYLDRRTEARKEQMRSAAKSAMRTIVEEIPLQHGPEDNAQWEKVFKCLARVKSEGQERDKAKERYYRREYADLAQPLFPKSSILKWDIKTAALLSASLTDIPARWFETMYLKDLVEREGGIDLGET
jgi:hypothetical protein